MDEHLAMDLAATQLSLITRDQARRLGLSSDQIQHRLSQRILAREHDGVYRFTSAPESPAQRLLAACLAVGPIAAASHRSAAAMHGIWSGSEAQTEITVGRDRSPELSGVTVHRLADLSDRWIVRIDGLWVTTPARTLVDLGAVLPLGSVGRALEFHAAPREFRHDRVRQNDLVDLGWTVHRFTWPEVDALSSRVARRIRRRRAELHANLLGTLDRTRAV